MSLFLPLPLLYPIAHDLLVILVEVQVMLYANLQAILDDAVVEYKVQPVSRLFMASL
jgi:hypothetical protein